MVIFIGTFVMKRILKVNPKNRKHAHIMIEREILTIFKENSLHLSDAVNLSLEDYLSKKGLLK